MDILLLVKRGDHMDDPRLKSLIRQRHKALANIERSYVKDLVTTLRETENNAGVNISTKKSVKL